MPRLKTEEGVKVPTTAMAWAQGDRESPLSLGILQVFYTEL